MTEELQKKYKHIRNHMTSKEPTEGIVKHIAVEFMKWSVGVMQSDGKDIVRKHYPDFHEPLFDYWLENIYKYE